MYPSTGVNLRNMHGRVPAKNFIQTLAVNVNNEKLSDEAFRELIRNTLPIVEGGEVLKEDAFSNTPSRK